MSERPKLDATDIAILSTLQDNGRMTNVVLAEAVGLSASPCLQRVRRLEDGGFIAGYGAEIALAKIVEMITIFTEITLRDHRREDFVKFEAGIRQFDEVVECHLISGGYDYLLKFIARSVGHYQSIIEHVLERNIGIEKYFSYIVIKSPIARRAAPLRKLLDAEW